MQSVTLSFYHMTLRLAQGHIEFIECMKRLFIIANWKSNKTIKDTKNWLHDFSNGLSNAHINLEDKKVIIAPPFTALAQANYYSGKLNLALGFAAQDVSMFEEGAYTGEVSGRQIKELASYVIIGHSERRNGLAESDEIVNKKVEQALEHDLTPILCFSDVKQIHNSIRHVGGHNSNCIVAYEPLFAIGSGNPDTPENADKMCQEVKNILGEVPTLYGGSVDKENVKSFTNMLSIDGALVGKASLDPLEFSGIVKNA